MERNGTGVVILSIGSDRRQMLFNAIASVQRHYPGLPVHVLSDVPVDVPFTWLSPMSGRSSRFYKTQIGRLSPFKTTLLLDDDAVIHRNFGDLDCVIGDGFDIAMNADGFWPTMGQAVDAGPRSKWCSQSEAAATALVNGWSPSHPHYNSGVMFFRWNDATSALFDKWHAEWMRFQDVDQLSLYRAITFTGARVRPLGFEYNCRPERTGAPENPFIFHFASNKKRNSDRYHADPARANARPHQLYRAYADAVNNGICTRHQYEAIGKLLKSQSPGRALIFGCGHDQNLWRLLNAGGQTHFLEHDEKWAAQARSAGCNVEIVEYPTVRGVDGGDAQPLPASVAAQEWDFVLVDAPTGMKAGTPGRQLPMRWASEIPGQPLVVAHDCERPWERTCALRYLGDPDFFLWGSRPHYGSLWFWFRGRSCAKDLLD